MGSHAWTVSMLVSSLTKAGQRLSWMSVFSTLMRLILLLTRGGRRGTQGRGHLSRVLVARRRHPQEQGDQCAGL